jgi:signal transduction histidine kinase
VNTLFLFSKAYAQQSAMIDFESRVDSLLQFNSKESVADILEKQGREYRSIADYTRANAAFTFSLKLREQIKSPLIALSHLYLGTVAGHRKEYELAIDHYKTAAKLASAQFDSLRLGQAFNNLGYDFSNIQNYDSSLKYLNKALLIKRNTGQSNIDLSATLNNLGVAYEGLNMMDSAIYFYKEALRLREKEGARELLVQSYNNIGYMHLIQGRKDSAQQFLTRGLQIAVEDSLVGEQRNLYLNMFRLYDKLENDSSHYFLNKHLKLLDVIYDYQSTQTIQRLRTEYDLEKKDITIAENELALERQKTQNRLYVIVGSGLLIFLIGLIIFLKYRERLHIQLRKKDVALHNQHVNQLIRDQEISILSARVEGQGTERQRIAEDLHDRLGSKLAAVKLYYDAAQEKQDMSMMDTARKLLDETIDETRRIAHNLASGVLTRFGLVAAIRNLKETLENSKKIDIEFVTHNFEHHELSKDLEENFYRIVQEILSNILKHARAKHITIQLTRHKDGMITLLVEDDGIGFNPDQVSLNSMGLQNLKNRVERFEGAMSIDSEPGHGTTIIVEIEEKQKVL